MQKVKLNNAILQSSRKRSKEQNKITEKKQSKSEMLD